MDETERRCLFSALWHRKQGGLKVSSRETHLLSLHTPQLCRQRRWVSTHAHTRTHTHTHTILHPSKKDLQIQMCTTNFPHNKLYFKKGSQQDAHDYHQCSPVAATPQSSRDLVVWTWALSGPVHGASVWNDVEGQTGDCGIVGAGYPLHQRGPRRQFAIRDVTPPPPSLHFILLTGKMCWKLRGPWERKRLIANTYTFQLRGKTYKD